MTPTLKFTTGLLLAGLVSLPCLAQKDPNPTKIGSEKDFSDYTKIEVKNFQDESLGRIRDLGIDLVNGRIVEVFILVDKSISEESKIIAVPPLMLIADAANEVYRMPASVEQFQSAPAVVLKKWEEVGRSENVAAVYRHFEQETYFLEEGVAPSKTAQRPKVPLGYVQRAYKILDMPVGNHAGEKFGKVWSLMMDIPKGRITNVVILAPGNFQTKSMVPAMALDFNAKRDGLLLDDTKREFAEQPRLVFSEGAFGQDSTYKRESYTGPRTHVALEQGVSYRDVDRTVQINRGIRAAKINSRNVEVGTMDGRVTLRGWVPTADDKRRIGEVAIAASRVEQVDNQIVIGKPGAGN